VGKIVSSLSYGVPVVASSIAAEGMQLRHKKNILVADDPDVMADQIVRLYGDAGLWLQLSLNGFEAFHTKFSEAGPHERKPVSQVDPKLPRKLTISLHHS
jgi:hypothetical protein